MSKNMFRKETLMFLARVHHLTLHDSDLGDYEQLRKELLTQNEQLAICAGALHDVIQVTCNVTGRDSQWMRLADIADAATSEDHNERSRLRALATVMALWSQDVICHYGWERESRAFLSALRVCARKLPNFCRDFTPYANDTMLRRHEQSLLDNKVPAVGEHYMRGRIQSPRSPLITKDVTHLAGHHGFAATPNDDNTRDVQYRLTHDCESCCASITVGGKTLRELRQHHYPACLLGLDRFGLLVPRRYAVDATPQCTSCQTNGSRPCSPTRTSSSVLSNDAGDVEHSSLTTGFDVQSDFTSIGPENPISSSVSSNTVVGLRHPENPGLLLDCLFFEDECSNLRSSHANNFSHFSPSAHTPWSLVDFEQDQPIMRTSGECHASPWPVGSNIPVAAPYISDTHGASIEHSLFEKSRGYHVLPR